MRKLFSFSPRAVGKSYIQHSSLRSFKNVPGRLFVSIPFLFFPLWPSESSHNLLHHCHADGVVTSKRSTPSPPPFWATLRVTWSWTRSPFPIQINTEIWVAPPVWLNPCVAPLEYWSMHAGRLAEEVREPSRKLYFWTGEAPAHMSNRASGRVRCYHKKMVHHRRERQEKSY